MELSPPIDRALGVALLWAVVDLVEAPTRQPTDAPPSPAAFARAVERELPRTAGAVRNAIDAIEQLHDGYRPLAAAARQALDGWIVGLAAVRDTTPFVLDGAQEWRFTQVNDELAAVTMLAGAAMPVPIPG